MLKYITVILIFFVSVLALGAMIGYAVPRYEVKLDRYGACTVVIDHGTGKNYDCGWEEGRHYTASY